MIFGLARVCVFILFLTGTLCAGDLLKGGNGGGGR